ncbi:MAG: metal ABC transporter substrate-binding protein [Proteobacteria bacterium]|nr:metal ABC transporter substrate-binding protein [Pseudomonadota bacterium]
MFIFSLKPSSHLMISFKKIFFLLMFLLPGCVCAQSPLKVVSSFSILSDLIQQVGGDHILLQTIVGPNEDTHVYEPTPKDAQHLAEADLIFINGLGFEGWIERLIETSGYKGEVINTSVHIQPRHDAQKCACLQGNHSVSSSKIDPHAWHNIPNIKSYINVIEKALSTKDPFHQKDYARNAELYQKKLDELDQKIQKNFNSIPKNKRVSITTHDGFGYFGDHYGIQFLSPVGLNTGAEPSAKTIAHLVDFIKKHHIKILFLENIASSKLMQQIASETGARLGPILYSDALSDEKGPASTYLKMMEHNSMMLIEGMN